jgi:hypothetical protein
MECSLARGDLLRLEGGARGVVLACLKGTLWLTCGDGVDYLVKQGSRFSLEAGSQALVEGIAAAEFRLEPAGRQGAFPATAELRACGSLT